MGQTHRGQYDAFDRGNGNGAASAEDDFLEQKSIFHNEWGSTAATTFNPSDTDAHGNSLSRKKKQKFEDLYALNNGKGEQSRRGDIRSSHIRNDAETFMSVLEMPHSQRKQVIHILENIKTDSNEFGGRKYEKIILAICSLVRDKVLSDKYTISTDTNIHEKRLYGKESFKDLMDSVGMSGTEYRKIREQVRQKSDSI